LEELWRERETINLPDESSRYRPLPRFTNPCCRSQSAQERVHVEHGWSLGRTPKSWAALA
jgi:hypothetical protein